LGIKGILLSHFGFRLIRKAAMILKIAANCYECLQACAVRGNVAAEFLEDLMHIYILGICGTFMGSLAVLAREAGFRVSGCDANVYPPMSTQLEKAGIKLDQGFKTDYLSDDIDLVVIGNAMSRGNPMVEYVLDKGLSYTSGPAFLHDHVLKDKWVLAVSGTHGKTTTSSMLSFILDYAGLKPGFLIGGVVNDFDFSARLGDSIFFVVEADEYDTAFFDKRSKFVHYMPRTLIMNNMEFDHADIFDDLSAIKRQFHHLLRIVPSNGRVIANANDQNIADVLAMGCWSETATFSSGGAASSGGTTADWNVEVKADDGSCFILQKAGEKQSEKLTVNWQLTGKHNIENALAAVAAAEHVGVRADVAVEALNQFSGVKRRMELLASVKGVDVYDDFAHHPTAIKTSLAGVKKMPLNGKVIAVIEPRSNTMKMGVHKDTLAAAVTDADLVYWYMADNSEWHLPESAGKVFSDMDELLADILQQVCKGDKVIAMSNGGFSGFHQKLIQRLENEYE
jgi:UDP-N-acetylmuramate: L-alanyl-gamma-D-glutamyl-meso-diaminopimelate ligase